MGGLRFCIYPEINAQGDIQWIMDVPKDGKILKAVFKALFKPKTNDIRESSGLTLFKARQKNLQIGQASLARKCKRKRTHLAIEDCQKSYDMGKPLAHTRAYAIVDKSMSLSSTSSDLSDLIIGVQYQKGTILFDDFEHDVPEPEQNVEVRNSTVNF